MGTPRAFKYCAVHTPLVVLTAAVTFGSKWAELKQSLIENTHTYMHLYGPLFLT